MNVRLLKDKIENGAVKTTLRPAKEKAIWWKKGRILEVSEATGEKLIEAGEAEKVTTEAAE